MSEDIRSVLDATKMAGGYGRPSSGVINILRGVNTRGSGNIVPANTDNQGLTFFTKPNLNLSYDNVKSIRRLNFLCDGDDKSMGSAIRAMLSPLIVDPAVIDRSIPRGNWRHSALPVDDRNNRSAVIDDNYAFITALSSTLVSMSGWPDFVLDTYTSKEGLRKEVTTMVDSVADLFGKFDLTANFQNFDGNPILALFAAWCEYAARVSTGEMNPYPQCIVEREIDYNTRIYRIVTDPTGVWVRQTAEGCVCTPTAVPIGAQFNFNQDDFQTPDTAQIGIRFECIGARYNDPITIYNFNRTVQIFNSYMRDGNRDSKMVKLTPPQRRLMCYEPMYPRISNTNELEWYMEQSHYNKVLAEIQRQLNLGNDLELNTGRPSTHTAIA